MLTYIYIKNIQNVNSRGVELYFNKSQNILIGPNASGKSNILKCLEFFKQLVLNQKPLELFPYRFSENKKDSEIKVIFKIDEIYYRYSILFNFHLSEVIYKKEYFDKSLNGKKFINIIKRNNTEVTYDSCNYDIGKNISSINFLNLFNKNDDLQRFYNFIDRDFHTIHLKDINIKNILINSYRGKESNYIFTTLSDKIKDLQIGIESIDITPVRYGKRDIALYHSDLEQLLSIDLESQGTKQLILILYFMFVLKSKVLVIDEAENNVHPSIIKKLITVFLESKSQLIFSTHSRELIDIEIPYTKIKNKKVLFIQKSNRGYVQVSDLDKDKIEVNINDDIYRSYYLDLFCFYTDKVSI